MHWFRITKYDPKFRNHYGHYQKDEWISFWEIGKSFEQKKLDLADYLATEDKYIEAVILFMKFLNISHLKINALEKGIKKINENYSKDMLLLLDSVHDQQLLNIMNIPNLIRLILRNNIWCKLESELMNVHFGSDYYMFIGCKTVTKKVLSEIEKKGLFVERFNSPFLIDN